MKDISTYCSTQTKQVHAPTSVTTEQEQTEFHQLAGRTFQNKKEYYTILGLKCESGYKFRPHSKYRVI